MKWETKGLEYSLFYMAFSLCHNRDFHILFLHSSKEERRFPFFILILTESNEQQIIMIYIFPLPLHTKGGTYLNTIGKNKFI